jgi:hypothetical protein
LFGTDSHREDLLLSINTSILLVAGQNFKRKPREEKADPIREKTNNVFAYIFTNYS